MQLNWENEADEYRVLGQSPPVSVLSVLYRQKSVRFTDRMEGAVKWKLEGRTSVDVHCQLIFREKSHLQVLVLPAGGRCRS